LLVFEAVFYNKVSLIDALPQAGGSVSKYIPKKPITDISRLPEVLAGDLRK